MCVHPRHVKSIVPESARGKDLTSKVEPLPGVGIPKPAHRIPVERIQVSVLSPTDHEVLDRTRSLIHQNRCPTRAKVHIPGVVTSLVRWSEITRYGEV